MPFGDEQIEYPLPNPDENDTGFDEEEEGPIVPIDDGDEPLNDMDREEEIEEEEEYPMRD